MRLPGDRRILTALAATVILVAAMVAVAVAANPRHDPTEVPLIESSRSTDVSTAATPSVEPTRSQESTTAPSEEPADQTQVPEDESAQVPAPAAPTPSAPSPSAVTPPSATPAAPSSDDEEREVVVPEVREDHDGDIDDTSDESDESDDSDEHVGDVHLESYETPLESYDSLVIREQTERQPAHARDHSECE